jgi:hypothetical protein
MEEARKIVLELVFLPTARRGVKSYLRLGTEAQGTLPSILA